GVPAVALQQLQPVGDVADVVQSAPGAVNPVHLKPAVRHQKLGQMAAGETGHAGDEDAHRPIPPYLVSESNLCPTYGVPGRPVSAPGQMGNAVMRQSSHWKAIENRLPRPRNADRHTVGRRGGGASVQIAIVTHDRHVRAYRTRALLDRLTRRGVQWVVLGPERMGMHVTRGSVRCLGAAGRPLTPDVVLNALYLASGHGLEIIEGFEAAGTPVVNRAAGWRKAKTKALASV